MTEAVQRLFALSITASFVMAFGYVSMDLIGWQCLRPAPDCTERLSWLGFLGWDWFASPGRRIVALSLVPLAAVGLLWWLSRETWLRMETTPVPARTGPADRTTPLAQRCMWNGGTQVRRLRHLHITTAVSLIALFLLAPLAVRDLSAVAGTLLTVISGLLAVSAVLACWPTAVDREDPATSRSRFDGFAVLSRLATACLVAVAVLVVVSDPDDFGTALSLPWLTGGMEWLLLGQFLALLLIFVLVIPLHRWRPRHRCDPPLISDRPAWFGQTAVVLMTGGLVMAGGFAAGLGIRVADILGEPVRDGAQTYIVPTGYLWAAALGVPLLIVIALLALCGWLWIRFGAHRSVRERIRAAYGGVAATDPARAGTIARTWARAEVSTIGQRLVGAAVIATAVILAAGAYGFLAERHWIEVHAAWAVKVGSFLVGGFVLVMLSVGRQAYRNPAFRRTVGVLWDLGTFWPRAAHPLAPPCYTERAIPDLITRIRYLTRSHDDARVLLSCHSQGSVIGAAVVLQLDDTDRKKVALLTYGSPLRRLYTRFFPGYFGLPALLHVGAVLSGSDTDRSTWPWRNLHRPSDPIGGPVFATYRATAAHSGDNDDVDRELIDPAFARTDGDTCDPPTCGHSDYYADPAFEESIDIIRANCRHEEAGHASAPGLLVASPYGSSGSG